MNIPLYPMDQLSVPPSSVRIPDGLLFRYVFGNVAEPQAVAALFIRMCQEQGDVWQGLTQTAITSRAEQHRGDLGGVMFSLRPAVTIAEGLIWHLRAGTVRLGGVPRVPVFYPVESLLEPLRKEYISR